MVCEPQSVATLVSRRGADLSLMSQTRMPSQYSVRFVVAGASHAALARRESVEVITMSPYAETSFCAPRQAA